MRNFKIETTEEEILQGFEKIAGVAPLRVRKRGHYAFVNFAVREDAQQALDCATTETLRKSRKSTEISKKLPVDLLTFSFSRNFHNAEIVLLAQ